MPAIYSRMVFWGQRFRTEGDTFLDDSFGESGAKVNRVMFRARAPYACVFPVRRCVCFSHNDGITCVGVRGRGAWNAAQCVESAPKMPRHECLCAALHCHAWAVGIAQRVHHIEGQHIVGSQTHTNHGVFFPSHSASLFLKKRSYTVKDRSFCFDSALIFFLTSPRGVFALSVANAFTQFYPRTSPCNKLYTWITHWHNKSIQHFSYSV